MSHGFNQRYLLARYPTGGVVVDLDSGNYYRVNASAALICDLLRTGDDAEPKLAAQLHIQRAEAARLVSNVIAALETAPVRSTPQGSYHFYPAEGGYVLRHEEQTVLEIDGTDLSIRLPFEGKPPQEAQLELYVRALAPKLLFQRGVTVLHASACLAGQRLIAFAGVSGAGKTTTARAFRDAGARLLSEDLVVLAPMDGPTKILLEGEASIQAWAQHVTEQLLLRAGKATATNSLNGILDGMTALLDQVLILDKTRRSGVHFSTSDLPEPDALISLMTHDFLGAIEPETWKRYFDGARAIVEKVEDKEAYAPDTLDCLVPAAEIYISRVAS